MMEIAIIVMLVQIALLTVVSVMFYLRGVRMAGLKSELASARRDTKHWYDECTKLEVKAHCTTTEPMHCSAVVPKDYEEQQI